MMNAPSNIRLKHFTIRLQSIVLFCNGAGTVKYPKSSSDKLCKYTRLLACVRKSKSPRYAVIVLCMYDNGKRFLKSTVLRRLFLRRTDVLWKRAETEENNMIYCRPNEHNITPRDCRNRLIGSTFFCIICSIHSCPRFV